MNGTDAASAAQWKPGMLSEALREQELAALPRTETGDLFHYTGTETAIVGILASGTLRLSPFTSTNDLWESRQAYPTVSSHADDDGDIGATMRLWDDIDRAIRLHTKVACLTADYTLPAEDPDRDSQRGWAHLPLWAHYGSGHAGVCLRFNRDKLLEAFHAHHTPSTLRFHGPVQYLGSSTPPATRGIDLGQVKEFGVDAAALAYAESNHELLFLRKHRSWAYEAEYRLVLLDQSYLPQTIDIRHALTGVILGESFPASRLPALHEALKSHPGVEVQQVRYFQRRLMLTPSPAASPAAAEQESPTAWAVPRRDGSLGDRLDALRDAEKVRTELRNQARSRSTELVQATQEWAQSCGAELRTWPQTHVATYPRIHAVPEQLRSRAPGVAGEQIHFEHGIICVVENLPVQSCTLVAATAFQILDNKQVRLHAVVTIERWDPDGNKREELWRTEQTVDAGDAQQALSNALTALREQAAAARPRFDETRRPGDA